MDGVTILDTIEIYALSWWQLVLGFIPLFIAAIVMFVRLYIAFKKGTEEEQKRGVINPANYKVRELLVAVVGGISSLVLLFCLAKYCPADYVETRYKVAVDNTASFVEFHDKYNILEKHPEYFIVKEKSE